MSSTDALDRKDTDEELYQLGLENFPHREGNETGTRSAAVAGTGSMYFKHTEACRSDKGILQSAAQCLTQSSQ